MFFLHITPIKARLKVPPRPPLRRLDSPGPASPW